MALSFTGVLTDAQAVASATTFTTTQTFTPVAGRLYLVHVLLRGFTSGGAVPTLDASAQGASNNCPNVLFKQFASFGNNYSALYRYIGPASPTAGALTITRQSTNTWNDLSIQVHEWAGNDQTGTNGSGAVLQAVYGENAASATGSVAITMTTGGALSSFWASFGGTGGATTPRASWTEVYDRNLTAQYGHESQGFVGTDTAGSVTFTTVDNVAGMVIEIKASGGAVPQDYWDHTTDPGFQPLITH